MTSYTLNIESVNVCSGLVIPANSPRVFQSNVNVSDGKLSMDQGSSVDKSTRINFVDVAPITSPTIVTAAACNPSPVLETGARLSVLGSDQSGEQNLVYTWSPQGTPPAGVVFSPGNGTNAAKNIGVKFSKSGSYTFKCEIRNSSNGLASSVVTVLVQSVIKCVRVTAGPATANSRSQAFSATGLDQFALPLAPQPSFTWSASGGGTVTSSGIFNATTGVMGGPFTITAAASGSSLTGKATVRLGARLIAFTGSGIAFNGAAEPVTVTISGPSGTCNVLLLNATFVAGGTSQNQASGSTVTYSIIPNIGASNYQVQVDGQPASPSFPVITPTISRIERKPGYPASVALGKTGIATVTFAPPMPAGLGAWFLVSPAPGASGDPGSAQIVGNSFVGGGGGNLIIQGNSQSSSNISKLQIVAFRSDLMTTINLTPQQSPYFSVCAHPRSLKLLGLGRKVRNDLPSMPGKYGILTKEEYASDSASGSKLELDQAYYLERIVRKQGGAPGFKSVGIDTQIKTRPCNDIVVDYLLSSEKGVNRKNDGTKIYEQLFQFRCSRCGCSLDAGVVEKSGFNHEHETWYDYSAQKQYLKVTILPVDVTIGALHAFPGDEGIEEISDADDPSVLPP